MALRVAYRRLTPRVGRCVQRGPMAARALCAAAPQTFLDSAEVTDRVISVLANFEKVDAAKITPTAHFTNDLGLDSLDTVEVVMAVEEEFALQIPDAEAEKIFTVADAVTFVSQHPQAR